MPDRHIVRDLCQWDECHEKAEHSEQCRRHAPMAEPQERPTECSERVIMMVPCSAVGAWTFQEKVGRSWKRILWYSGKIAFVFSVSIEMLQLLLRLGTFQLSDIFYNTVGGVVGGLVYYATMKARKRL